MSKAWDEASAGSWELPEKHCYACEDLAALKKNLQDDDRPGRIPYLQLNEDDMQRARKIREARARAQEREASSE